MSAWQKIETAPKDGTPIIVGVSYRFQPCDLAKHHAGECRCRCDAKFDNRPAEVIIREDRDAWPH